MNVRLTRAVWMLVLLVVWPSGQGARADSVDQLRAKIDRLVAPLVENDRVVGLVVGVRRGDDEFFLPYGRVKPGEDAAPTPDTVYEIGSITKAFTGTLLADMSLRGEIDVDRPVKELLPAGVLPEKDQPITLGMLATHTSGLPRMPTNFDFADPAAGYSAYEPKLAYEFLRDHKLRRAPGEFEYSNLGMGLLGQVLADRAGKSYDELVQERICRPLGLRETCIVLPAELQARLAPPYDADLRPQREWPLNLFFAGAGGLHSTARDTLRFAAAMASDDESEVVKALKLAGERRHTMADKQAIGLAWHIARDGVTRWHNGQTGGYTSYAACVPDKRLAVVVLCNTATDYTTILGEKIVQTAWGLDVEPPTVVREVELAPEVLERYVGRYWLSPFFVLTVKLDEGRLMVRATGQEAFPIYPSGEREFFYRVVDARITFTVDDEGRVTKLTLHQNGKDMDGLRQPEFKPSKSK